MLMERMRLGLILALAFHVVLLHFTRGVAERGESTPFHVWFVRLIVVVILWTAQAGAVAMRRTTADLASGHSVTDSIRYDRVLIEKGYRPERYVCPAAAKARHLRGLMQHGVDQIKAAQEEGERRRSQASEAQAQAAAAGAGSRGAKSAGRAKVAPAPLIVEEVDEPAEGVAGFAVAPAVSKARTREHIDLMKEVTAESEGLRGREYSVEQKSSC